MIEVTKDDDWIVYRGEAIGVGANRRVCIVVFKINTINKEPSSKEYGVFIYRNVSETLKGASDRWFTGGVSICSEPRVRRIKGIDCNHLIDVFENLPNFNFIWKDND